MRAAFRLLPDPVSLPAATPDVLPFGMARLATELFRGRPFQPLEAALIDRLREKPLDAGALHDLATLIQLVGHETTGLQVQTRALALNQMFRVCAPDGAKEPVRLLMFAVPGNFMANMPIEFLLIDRPVQLDIVYLMQGEPFPAMLPDHDVVLVGIAESDATRAVLMELGVRLAIWPKPVLNLPHRIGLAARDVLPATLEHIGGVLAPTVQRVSRETLLEEGLPAAAYPMVVRPCGSHAGQGLDKIDDAQALQTYLEARPEAQFFASPFIDYRSSDGQFRKYRISAIGGQFFPCHVAISGHWMVHYLNAGMAESAAKREEEARAIASFGSEFGQRHGRALEAIAKALDLDYFSIDCAELPDGRLLIFEAGTAMIVHQMESPELYPYRAPAIDAICDRLVDLLDRARRP